MKKIILIVFLISLSIVQSVSGFSVSGVTTTPSGYLSAGTSVSTAFNITFAPSSGETFPSGSDLLFLTDLTSP